MVVWAGLVSGQRFASLPPKAASQPPKKEASCPPKLEAHLLRTRTFGVKTTDSLLTDSNQLHFLATSLPVDACQC